MPLFYTLFLSKILSSTYFNFYFSFSLSLCNINFSKCMFVRTHMSYGAYQPSFFTTNSAIYYSIRRCKCSKYSDFRFFCGNILIYQFLCWHQQHEKLQFCHFLPHIENGSMLPKCNSIDYISCINTHLCSLVTAYSIQFRSLLAFNCVVRMCGKLVWAFSSSHIRTYILSQLESNKWK